jgi:hypothetical protein
MMQPVLLLSDSLTTTTFYSLTIHMEASLEQRMLTDTLGAFGEGSSVDITPDRGLLLIEGWLNALRGDVGAERVRAELETLRDNLASGNPDGNMIRHLLLSMASHTSTLAGEPSVADGQTESQLRQLANALRNFSSQF